MTTSHKSLKKEHVARILLFWFVVFLLFLPIFVFAQETFVPLTEGSFPGIDRETSFNDFLNTMFNFGLAVAATLAVIMLTIGGFFYMTTDSVLNKSDGKEMAQNAIIGLLIALLIWLILFTINPNILNFDIKIGNTNDNKADKGEIEKNKKKAGEVLIFPGKVF